MQFASHAFPLPQIVDSIDAALGAVQESLQCVGVTLGLIHAQHADSAEARDFKASRHPDIPDEVLRQLKEAGFNLESLTAGELHDAALSYAVDGTVIDDPEDTTLRGKMQRSDAEIEQREEKKSPLIVDPQGGQSFTALARNRRILPPEARPDHYFQSLVEDSRTAPPAPELPR